MFVCIEGIDASGKATQSKLLAERLEARLFSFPDYDTPMGQLIRGHLQQAWRALPDVVPSGFVPPDEKVAWVNALVFQSLQLSNRMEHAPEMRKLLSQGRHIVADRYWPSGWVYGSADGLDGEYLWTLHECLPQPDLFFLLEIDPSLSSVRRPNRRDRYEKQAGLMGQAALLYAQYWKLQQSRGDCRWYVVDASRSVDDVHRAIWSEVQTRLEEEGCPLRPCHQNRN